MEGEEKTKEQLFKELASLKERLERRTAELEKANDRKEINHGISAGKAAESGPRNARDELNDREQERTEDLTATNRTLAKSVERYRVMVENALDIVYSVSFDGKIEDLNPAFEKVTGWSAKDWIGKDFEPLIHPDDLSNILDRRGKLLDGEMLPSAVARILTKSGDYMLLEFKTVPSMKDEKVERLIGTARDITDRKRMEEALQRANVLLEERVQERTIELARSNEALRINEARLEALWELSQLSGASEKEIADFVLDRQVSITGSEFGMFGFINEDETFVTLHAWSQKVLRECALQHTHWPVEESVIWADLMTNRQPMIVNDCDSIKWRVKGCPSGHATLRRVMSVPVFDGERIVAVAMVANKDSAYDESDARQVSLLLEGMWRFMERERAEKALRNSERLAAMGSTLAALAHDIKTPLISIGGFTQLVQRHLEPGSQDCKALDIVLKETKRLEKMVKDMLDFSRPLKLEKSPENVCGIVKETIEIVSDEAQRKKVTVDAHLSQCENLVSMDAMRMRQALINLVMNAIQATPEDRTISINLGRTEQDVVFDVVDCGCGIPLNQRSEIFSPFFTTKKEGTGLGLPIVKKIVEAHKGHLEILDNPDTGLTFRVLLPIAA
ncbi:MAG: ATP-binding protein [Syntrophobacteraceae bacterium]